MERYDTEPPRLPPGYIGQHTLWTRRTFEERDDSKEWRRKDGMIIFMPRKDEIKLHSDFLKLYPERDRYGGLPLPSRELTRVALAHINALDPILGRKRQFESMARYMRELAETATIKTQADEANLFAGHFAVQLDYYGNALTADDERELGFL